MTKQRQRKTKIGSIVDLIPARSHNKVDELPKGKPKQTSTWQFGPASIKTYFFKRDVYLRLRFHNRELFYKKNPVIVDDMGRLLRS